MPFKMEYHVYFSRKASAASSAVPSGKAGKERGTREAIIC